MALRMTYDPMANAMYIYLGVSLP